MKKKKIAIIWRNFLPYHNHRLKIVGDSSLQLGFEYVGIEVTKNPAVINGMRHSRDNKDHRSFINIFDDSDFRNLKNRLIWENIKLVLNEERPDVILCPACPFPEGMGAIQWANSNGSVVVIMDDASDISDRSGLFTRWIKRHIYNYIDGVFVPTEEYASYWLKFGIERDRLVPGVNVVDNVFFSQNPNNIRREPILLFVGRLIPEKGLDVLLAAYRAYRKKVHNPWELYVVGPNESNFCGELGVNVLGSLDQFALRDMYHRASLLVLPSRSESWGLVVNEAIASGLPVLCSSVVGARLGLVENNRTGWLFESEDSESLRETILSITKMEHPERDAVAAVAFARLSASFSAKNFLNGVTKILSLKRKPRKGILSELLVRIWFGRVRLY